jgi:phage gp45-like
MDRVTLSRASRQSQMSISRGTVREFEDDHLVQEIKEVDVFHSETASNKGAPLERFQMVGMTAYPLKQQEDQQQQGQQQQGGSAGSGQQDDGLNHNQPKGPAAEALMLYLNGSRSHPVAMVDDRRVRPYGMSEGEGAHYAPDGSEQMVLFKENGTYVVSLDGKSVKDKDNDKTRMVSMRHVTKDMQTHKIEKKQQSGQGGQQSQQQQEKYKHEGKTVNTEVRCTKTRISFFAGETEVGYYDTQSETWHFQGKVIDHAASDKITQSASNNIERTAPTISEIVSSRYETVGKTYLGIDSKGEGPPTGETGNLPYKQTYVKLGG